MKKIVFALLIVLMLMMPACNAENGNVGPQSSSSVQNPQNLVSSSDTSEEKSNVSEKDTAHASSSEKKRENSIGLKEYDAMLNTIDRSSVVCSLYNNEETFEDYYAEGMANVYDENKAYALVKQFHGSYTLYLTADGGKTWTNSKEGIVFLEKSYDDDSIPLPNGECLEFINLYNEIPQYLYDTEVRVYGVNKENSSFYEKKVKGWFDIFNFGEDVSFVTEAEYCGDNSYHLTMWNRINKNEVLFNGTVIVNSKTLLPDRIISREMSAGMEFPSENSIEKEISDNDDKENTINWNSLISENNSRLIYSFVYDENKAYAIISEGSGAGHSFYKVFITVDDGNTWTEDYNLQLTNYSRYTMTQFENGDILAFQNCSEDFPIDTNIMVYGIDKKTDNLFTKELDNWFDVFNIDEAITFITEAEYSNNYSFHIIIKEKSNEKNVLFSGMVEIDSETYLPKGIIRDNKE